MKKALILLVFIASFVVVNAQRGRVYSVTVDTVKGNENIYLTQGAVTGAYNVLSAEIDFSKVSAAAGGTAYFQGSLNGTTYSTLTSTDDLFLFYPNDTVTVTDGGTMKVVVKDNPFNHYRWFIDGDANDTVICTPYYLYK